MLSSSSQELKYSNIELVLSERTEHLPDILDFERSTVTERCCRLFHLEMDGSPFNMEPRLPINISGAGGETVAKTAFYSQIHTYKYSLFQGTKSDDIFSAFLALLCANGMVWKCNFQATPRKMSQKSLLLPVHWD